MTYRAAVGISIEDSGLTKYTTLWPYHPRHVAGGLDRCGRVAQNSENTGDGVLLEKRAPVLHPRQSVAPTPTEPTRW